MYFIRPQYIFGKQFGVFPAIKLILWGDNSVKSIKYIIDDYELAPL